MNAPILFSSLLGRGWRSSHCPNKRGVPRANHSRNGRERGSTPLVPYPGLPRLPRLADTLVTNNGTPYLTLPRGQQDMTPAIESHPHQFAPIASNADTSPRIAEVHLARHLRRLSTSPKIACPQTEPLTEPWKCLAVIAWPNHYRGRQSNGAKPAEMPSYSSSCSHPMRASIDTVYYSTLCLCT